TGWSDGESALREIVERSGIGVIAAANFSLGMQVFKRTVAEASARFASMPDVGAWVHESHHAQKKDAPSGTALLLTASMANAGYKRPIDVSSTRAGSIPGTHVVGFDGPSETVTLTHTVRDRAVFARGALEAAAWVRGRRGWFTGEDMVCGQHSRPSERGSSRPSRRRAGPTRPPSGAGPRGRATAAGPCWGRGRGPAQ